MFRRRNITRRRRNRATRRRLRRRPDITRQPDHMRRPDITRQPDHMRRRDITRQPDHTHRRDITRRLQCRRHRRRAHTVKEISEGGFGWGDALVPVGVKPEAGTS